MIEVPDVYNKFSIAGNWAHSQFLLFTREFIWKGELPNLLIFTRNQSQFPGYFWLFFPPDARTLHMTYFYRGLGPSILLSTFLSDIVPLS